MTAAVASHAAGRRRRAALALLALVGGVAVDLTAVAVVGKYLGAQMSAADAVAKIAAGADVVQIYTGLIYQGPALVPQAAQAIRDARKRQSGQ